MKGYAIKLKIVTDNHWYFRKHVNIYGKPIAPYSLQIFMSKEKVQSHIDNYLYNIPKDLIKIVPIDCI